MKNKSPLKLALFLSFLLTSYSTFCQQGAPISDVDVLAEQKKVLIEHHPGIFKSEEITKIERIDDKHSKIYYQRGNANFEAIVNSDRKDMLLVATCEQISEDRLPSIVLDHFHKSKEGSRKIEKSFIVKTPSSSDFYRIDVDDKNNKIKSIFYDHVGMGMLAPY